MERQIETVDADECLKLLATQSVGRLAYIVRDRPMITPVNYHVTGGAVVIRVDIGQKFGSALRDGFFALQADSLDSDTRTGWTVTLTGPASWLTDEEAAGLEGVLKTWAPGERAHFLRIEPHQLGGRRIAGEG